MLTAQRRKEIFHLLESLGQVQLTELAARYNVSIMTVRRDLEKLEQEGKARRVHGGAVLSRSKWTPDAIEVKVTTNISLKRMIAQNALKIFSPGSSIFLDAGSTTLEIAKALCKQFEHTLTICTTDLKIADVLSNEERFQVYSCGGYVDRNTFSVGGKFSIDMIEALHADLAIIGCDGLTLKDGAMGTRTVQVDVKKAMMGHSLQCALVVDSTKIGRVSFATIAALSAFDYVISDEGLDDEQKENIRKLGAEIIT